jgi:hypothetical protein
LSSTDDTLRRFYAERIAPAAEALRRRGVTFFTLAPTEPPTGTWYEGPPDEPELVQVSPERFGDELRAMWTAQQLPELAALAGPLGELCTELEVKGDESSDVSPFVYVMF